MLLWSENAFWGTAGFQHAWSASAYPPEPEHQAAFERSVKEGLREMIRIHRNHPSIIAWSMCNEVFFTADSTMPKVRELLKQTVALTHELDPTRPAAIGGCQRGDIDKLGDLAGYNGDGARLFMNPGIASVVSEYGSTMADRPGEYAPGWGDLQQERFPWRSGEAIWCAFDHGSIAGRKFGGMGMIDYFRLPKRQWYWYRNAYRNIAPPEWPADGVPAGLKLTADQASSATAESPQDALLVVTVIDAAGKPVSNCPPVTLTLESGPGEFPTGPSISFAPDSDIAIRDGQAAIGFRSHESGTSRILASSPGLSSATVELSWSRGPVFVPGLTSAVKPRPYLRHTAAGGSDVSRFGGNTPTRSSSEAAAHSARLANDGDSATFWQAAAGDAMPWLRIDLERIVNIGKSRLTFPAAGDWRYRVEVSEDGERNWMPLKENARPAPGESVCEDVAPVPVRGRFLRVTMLGSPVGRQPAVAEIEAFGSIH